MRDANTVARRFAGEFEQANAAYVAYSRGELRPARARTDLTAAAAAIRTARGDVAELDPPPDAQLPAREVPALPRHERRVRRADRCGWRSTRRAPRAR